MQKYYHTANKDVPHNDREPGEIAPIALAQLEEYRKLAAYWSVYLDTKKSGADRFGNPDVRKPMRCSACKQAIWFLCDEHGNGYDYTDDQIMTLTVAHIRQAHAEVLK